MTVAGLLLAAGAGSRYGMPKALATPYGEPLVLHGSRTLRAAGLTSIVIVLGAACDEVRALLAEHDEPARTVDNADWSTGMGSSLRAGLGALEPLDADAAIVLLVDTPGITPAAVARIAHGADRAALVAATYGGKQGHPVLLGRDHWAGVAATAAGDVGARPYLRAHAADLRLVACDDVADGSDLDVPP
jgi:nicotine blue oxidoreductase